MPPGLASPEWVSVGGVGGSGECTADAFLFTTGVTVTLIFTPGAPRGEGTLGALLGNTQGTLKGMVA